MVPRIYDVEPINLAGAVTSVQHRRAANLTRMDNAVAPHLLVAGKEQAHWAQLNRLVFYPLPWERRWYHTVHLLGPDRAYDLVYSRQGPHRALITLKSQPFTVRYTGQPYFKSNPIDVTCRLYRVISVYAPVDSWVAPQSEFYSEELSVRDEQNGRSLAFRAYFSSFLPFEAGAWREFARLEHIPDFFTAWRGCYGQAWGYGFSADSHCRQIEISGDSVSCAYKLATFTSA